jgi:hypothetical protein
MRDLHLNIQGPRDRARQNVSLRIADSDNRQPLDVAQIGHLVDQLRLALEQSPLSPDDARRAQRHLAVIEKEAASERPLLTEINDSLSFLGKLAQTANGLIPLFSSTFQLLCAAVGKPAAG